MSDSLKCRCGRILFTNEERDFHKCGKCLDTEVERANARAEWEHCHNRSGDKDDQMPLAESRLHPVTGDTLTRAVRTQKVEVDILSVDLEVPGWYPEGDGDSIHTGADLAETEATILRLREELRK